MLLSVLEKDHKGIYDFLYLPIDLKVCHISVSIRDWLRLCFVFPDLLIYNVCFCLQNKCNLGYAYINIYPVLSGFYTFLSILVFMFIACHARNMSRVILLKVFSMLVFENLCRLFMRTSRITGITATELLHWHMLGFKERLNLWSIFRIQA